jgi:hypothetical protein
MRAAIGNLPFILDSSIGLRHQGFALGSNAIRVLDTIRFNNETSKQGSSDGTAFVFRQRWRELFGKIKRRSVEVFAELNHGERG